jgi:predicted nucleic acid-binding protein
MAPNVTLRSIDAIHLACVAAVGAALRAMVTYDTRLRAGAESLGVLVEAPA